MREYHGHGKTGAKPPEYHSWQAMKQRCLNPTVKRYPSYGGRGITICQEWIESFVTFLADMGPRPSPDHSLDRVDNDGPYSKANCRWASRSEQQMNKRGFGKSGARGVRKTPAGWQAFQTQGKKFTQLYCGPSFEDAKKSRQEWELSMKQLVLPLSASI